MEKLRPKLTDAIAAVLDHQHFVMGPEVELLESELSAVTGASHVVSCSSGTDALSLALMAHGIGPGDVVIVPSFTFAATAEAVALLGAYPFFVDVDRETFLIAPGQISAAADECRSHGLRVRAAIAVDLFGLPCDYAAFHAEAESLDLLLIADAAQSMGASQAGASVGSLAHVTTTSFFPSKPLACYGDGGAVFTDDSTAADVMRSLRVHGQGESKYENVRVGLNARLDTLQAVVLLVKLSVFKSEVAARQAVAERYTAALSGSVTLPHIPSDRRSAWAHYTVVADDRASLVERLNGAGVPHAIYYPRPLHLQEAYSSFPRSSAGLEDSEYLSQHVVSLPMHPYLSIEDQDAVIKAVTG